MRAIFARLSRAAKTDFVRVSAWSGISTGIKMLTGLISIKIVSTIVGPAGIAMVGQFLNSISMVSMLATGGIGQGVTKLIAEYGGEPEKQKSVIAHAFRITLVFTAAISLLVILFSAPLTIYIFKTREYHSLIILLGLSVVLYSVNTLLIHILNGFKSFKKFVIVNITSSILGLAVTVILVIQWGLYGALLNCILSQSVIIAVTLLFLHKEPWFRTILKSQSIQWHMVKRLGGFTLMALTTAIIVPFTQLFIRSYIATHTSIQEAGIWEGINRLSGMYLMLITTSISVYYLPRLSEIKEQHILRSEIFKTGKFILPALALAFLAVYLIKDFIILFVFSSEFLPMRELFSFQLMGDLFKMASFLLAFLFWAKGMTKIYIACEVFFSIIMIVLVRFGVQEFGLQGSVYGYAGTYFLYLITMLFIFRQLLFYKR